MSSTGASFGRPSKSRGLLVRRAERHEPPCLNGLATTSSGRRLRSNVGAVDCAPHQVSRRQQVHSATLKCSAQAAPLGFRDNELFHNRPPVEGTSPSPPKTNRTNIDLPRSPNEIYYATVSARTVNTGSVVNLAINSHIERTMRRTVVQRTGWGRSHASTFEKGFLFDRRAVQFY